MSTLSCQDEGKVERPIRYVRESFFYGRAFLNDEDLNQQAISWTQYTANTRLHRTKGEVPQVRFDRDERATLQALTGRPYRLVLAVPATSPPQPRLPGLPEVERRPLTIYSRIAGMRA